MKSRLPENEVVTCEDERRAGDEDFLIRWSRRKREAQQVQQPAEEDAAATASQAISNTEQVDRLPTDADMPPLESLTEDSDYSGFLSPKVSEALRKQALGKLFHSAGINVRDGLDDYDEDFTEFEKLGNIVTADLKHRMDQEMRKQLDEPEGVSVEPRVTAEDNEHTEQQQASTDKTTEAEDEET